MSLTGTCHKHGEFTLTEGCKQCLGGKQGAPKVESTPEPPEPIVVAMPLRDKEVLAFYKEGLKLFDYAEKRVITTDIEVKNAAADLALIAKVKKAMLEKQKGLTGPLKADLATINESFKTLMAPIENAWSINREKVLAYNEAIVKEKAKEDEINRLRMEAAEKEMALKGELSEPVGLVETSPAPSTHVTTDLGGISQKANWQYVVEDFKLLPDEYKVEDSVLLGKTARNHHDKKQIPGVRFYNKPTIQVNTK